MVKESLRNALAKMKFFQLECQRFYPLLDMGFTPKEVLDQMENYGISNFDHNIEVLKRVPLIPLICELFTIDAVRNAKEVVNLFNIPGLFRELNKGKAMFLRMISK